MKIVHFAANYYPESAGGIESYLRDLTDAQRASGIEPVLVTGSFEPHSRCEIVENACDGLRHFRIHRDDWFTDRHMKSWHPEVEALVEELLGRLRPDLVHVHQWLYLTSNLVEIADRLGIPAVVTLHDLYTSCPRCFRVRPGDEACFRTLSVKSCFDCVPRYGHESERELAEGIELFRDQYRSELALARVVVCATATTARLIAETTATPRERFTVASLGYSRRFAGKAIAPAPAGGPGVPFRCGYWGNLTHRKGTHVLLEAFRRLGQVALPRPVELHLFGRIDTQVLQAELEGLAKGRPVTFHGRFSYDQLAAAGLHLAVFPMICFETFGFVLDEACELGLPSIVTGIGALPERAGDAALVVPPNDAAALADAIARIVADPVLLERMRGRLPQLPPEPGEHARAVAALYAQALRTPRAVHAPRIPLLRRAAFLLQQRESAQRKLTPPGGPV